MLAFGTSVIRLAEIARHSGRAAEAVSELWPLITRLEARVAAGYAEPEAMSLLAQARMSLGVALGHLLPDERLATAARWTGRALRIAWHLGDRPLLGLVLRMHGNELRKAGHPAAGIIRLRQALQVDDHPVRQGAGLVLLARAAAESGQADLFDATASQCVQALADRDQSRMCCSTRSPSGRSACAGCWRPGVPLRLPTWPDATRPAAGRRPRTGGSSSGSPPLKCSPGPETSTPPRPC